MLNLESIDRLVLQPGTKGVPVGVGPISLAEARSARWRLHKDLAYPVAVLRRSALVNNANWMKRFIQPLPGVVLCPHGKTTMAPQMFDLQLRNGAWGLTCATVSHLRSYRHFGVSRIIFANQIVERSDAQWLARELRDDPTFEVYVFVDSLIGARRLAEAALETNLQRPISLLLEVGLAGGRTGVQTVEEAMALARHIKTSDGVELSGVATFEGVVPGHLDEEMEPHVEKLFAETARVTKALALEGLFRDNGDVILSAGGSRFFDLAAERLRSIDINRRKLVVLRSGCYISHDASHYEAAFKRLSERQALIPSMGRLENALEVWSSIQSRPEAERAYANIGKRDVSYDIRLPQILSGRRDDKPMSPSDLDGVRVIKLSDQHAHLEVPPHSPLRFGDKLAFGISHPCTTFDKWNFLFELDDDDIVVDIIATMF
jgi:D-serine dehydratase